MFTTEDVNQIELFEVGDAMTSDKLNSVLTSIEQVINAGGSGPISTVTYDELQAMSNETIALSPDRGLSIVYTRADGTKVLRPVNGILDVSSFDTTVEPGQNGQLVYEASTNSLYMYTSTTVQQITPGWHKIN